MEKNRMYGLGEPISYQVVAGKIDLEETLKRVKALGITAFREWIHITNVLDDPETPKTEVLPVYNKVLDWMTAHDIEVTGMCHNWFLADGTKEHNAMFPRDLTPGSLYMQTLEMMEKSWYTMVKLFPQVEQWEVGNEWNSDTFLHPVGWQPGTPGFTEDEKLDIAVDMMYFSAKGIRAANPNAKVVSFSPAIAQPNLGSRTSIYCPPAYGIPQCISGIYQRIKSGKFWSDNTDDYFDMLAWHPYLLTHLMPMAVSEEYPAQRRFLRLEEMDSQWRAVNDMTYTIMSMFGDGHKKVLLTEMGFTDWQLPGMEEKQAQLTEDMFELIKTMPYVKTIHYFRLYAPKLEEINTPGFLPMGEVCFGMFQKEDGVYKPRKKAYTLQKIYGGTGSLTLED